MSQFKPPIWKRTFEFYKRLVGYNDCSSGKVAQISGVEVQTVDSWTRPADSDEYPGGSGKRNTTDCALRQIGLAYKNDPGLAHEWAELFPDYVKFLDEQAGVEYHKTGGCVHEALAHSSQEHTDILVALLHCKNVNWAKVWSEIKQAQSALSKLAAIVKEEMKGRDLE